MRREKRSESQAPRDPIVLKQEEDRNFVTQQMENVRCWVDSTQPCDVGNGSSDSQPATLVLDPSNSYLRAALYQHLEQEYGKSEFYVERLVHLLVWKLVINWLPCMYFFCATVLLRFHILHACHTAARNEILGCQEYWIECLSGQATVGSRKSSLKLTRATTEVIAAQQSEVTAKRQRQLEHAVGFANVMQALTTCNKPVVGHNMLLDLAYLYHQFVGHLPPSLDEFRKQVTDQFCQLYDWIRSDQDGLSGFGCCGAVSDNCTHKPQKQTFPVACLWYTVGDEQVQILFPAGIYDTKYLAGLFPVFLPSTSLEDIYTALASETTTAIGHMDGIVGFDANKISNFLPTAPDDIEKEGVLHATKAPMKSDVLHTLFADLAECMYCHLWHYIQILDLLVCFSKPFGFTPFL